MKIEQKAFKVKLFVNDQVVAESDDISLWQAVLSAISKNTTSQNKSHTTINNHLQDNPLVGDMSAIDDSLMKFSSEIDIDASVLQGACDPQLEEPFLHLDMKCWSSWDKNVPKRGQGAVSSIAVSATMLCLWFKSTGLENPTIKQSQAVLSNINIYGNNPSRSIKNCPWLQLRNQSVRLNPAEIDNALEVVRAFCEKRPPQF